MADLTERQQQIKALYDADKTPPQIAAELGITTNAVYQQLRRMKDRAGAPAKKSPAKKTVKRAPASRTTAAGKKAAKAVLSPTIPTDTMPPVPAPVQKTERLVTPLQAIRARIEVIQTLHREADSAVSAAEKVLTAARERSAKVKSKSDAELSQLRTAEAALTAKPLPATAIVESTMVGVTSFEVAPADVTIEDAVDDTPEVTAPAPKAKRAAPKAPKPAAPNGNGSDAVATPPAAVSSETA